MTWTEGKIARILARNTFKDNLCVLPNCTWTGHEIDLLVVANGRRIVDVEIKISRADLRADKHKSKWWHQPPTEWVPDLKRHVRPDKQLREWPHRVWKHYFAMPADIWREELRDDVQPVSGVLLIHDGRERVECIKRARPCRDAHVLSDAQVVAIARLASLRMWDAYARAERAREMREMQTATTSGLMTVTEARAQIGVEVLG